MGPSCAVTLRALPLLGVTAERPSSCTGHLCGLNVCEVLCEGLRLSPGDSHGQHWCSEHACSASVLNVGDVKK